MQTKQIAQEIFIGAQPQKEDIAALAAEGVQTVVNLRVENESDDQLSPVDEAQLVREAGMEYLHIPVIGSQIREGQVDEFRNAVEKLPKPIFVHCAKGKRAALFTVMDQSVREQTEGKNALSRISDLGYACADTNLRTFVKDYVDSRKS
jgi:uncharacterized protein (TIGR01244 family)